jgi:hypothetical protein
VAGWAPEPVWKFCGRKYLLSLPGFELRNTISRPIGVKDNFSIFSQLNCNVCDSCGLLKTLTMILDTALTRVKQYRCKHNQVQEKLDTGAQLGGGGVGVGASGASALRSGVLKAAN